MEAQKKLIGKMELPKVSDGTDGVHYLFGGDVRARSEAIYNLYTKANHYRMTSPNGGMFLRYPKRAAVLEKVKDDWTLMSNKDMRADIDDRAIWCPDGTPLVIRGSQWEQFLYEFFLNEDEMGSHDD